MASSEVRLNSSGGPMYHLRRIGPPATVEGVADIMEVTYMIGRNRKQVDFVLDSSDSLLRAYISRCHARVVRRAGNQHRLFDDSLNGVFINNTKIAGSVVLEDGDRVTFGHPGGDRLRPGSRHRQPNSQYQFLFELCTCQTETLASQTRTVPSTESQLVPVPNTSSVGLAPETARPMVSRTTRNVSSRAVRDLVSASSRDFVVGNNANSALGTVRDLPSGVSSTREDSADRNDFDEMKVHVDENEDDGVEQHTRDTEIASPGQNFTVLKLYEEQGGSEDTVLKSCVEQKGLEDTILKPCVEEEGLEDTVLKSCVEEEGLEDTVLNSCVEEEGLEDTILKSFEEQDVMEDTVLKSCVEEGSEDTTLKSCVEEEGLEDTVLKSCLEEEGLEDNVLKSYEEQDGLDDIVLKSCVEEGFEDWPEEHTGLVKSDSIEYGSECSEDDNFRLPSLHGLEGDTDSITENRVVEDPNHTEHDLIERPAMTEGKTMEVLELTESDVFVGLKMTSNVVIKGTEKTEENSVEVPEVIEESQTVAEDFMETEHEVIEQPEMTNSVVIEDIEMTDDTVMKVPETTEDTAFEDLKVTEELVLADSGSIETVEDSKKDDILVSKVDSEDQRNDDVCDQMKGDYVHDKRNNVCDQMKVCRIVDDGGKGDVCDEVKVEVDEVIQGPDCLVNHVACIRTVEGGVEPIVDIADSTTGSGIMDRGVCGDTNVTGLVEDYGVSDRTITTEMEDSVTGNRTVTTEIEDSVIGDRTITTEMEDSVTGNRTVTTEIEDSVIGDRTITTEMEDSVIGDRAITTEIEDSAIGDRTVTTKMEDSAIGDRTITTEMEESVVGDRTITTEIEDSAIGDRTVTTEMENSVTGDRTVTTEMEDSVTGDRAITTEIEDSAIGDRTVTTKMEDSAIGDRTITTEMEDSAIGDRTITTEIEDSVIGDRTITTEMEDSLIGDRTTCITTVMEDSVIGDRTITTEMEDSVIGDRTVTTEMEDSVIGDRTITTEMEDSVIGDRTTCVDVGVDQDVLGERALVYLSEDDVLGDGSSEADRDSSLIGDKTVNYVTAGNLGGGMDGEGTMEDGIDTEDAGDTTVVVEDQNDDVMVETCQGSKEKQANLLSGTCVEPSQHATDSTEGQSEQSHLELSVGARRNTGVCHIIYAEDIFMNSDAASVEACTDRDEQHLRNVGSEAEVADVAQSEKSACPDTDLAGRGDCQDVPPVAILGTPEASTELKECDMEDQPTEANSSVEEENILFIKLQEKDKLGQPVASTPRNKALTHTSHAVTCLCSEDVEDVDSPQSGSDSLGPIVAADSVSTGLEVLATPLSLSSLLMNSTDSAADTVVAGGIQDLHSDTNDDMPVAKDSEKASLDASIIETAKVTDCDVTLETSGNHGNLDVCVDLDDNLCDSAPSQDEHIDLDTPGVVTDKSNGHGFGDVSIHTNDTSALDIAVESNINRGYSEIVSHRNLAMNDSHIDTGHVVNTDCSQGDTDRVVNTDCSQGDTGRVVKMDNHVDTDHVVNTDCSQRDTDCVVKMDDNHVDTGHVVNTDCSQGDADRVVNTDCSQGDTDRVVKMDNHVDTDHVVNTDCSKGDTDRVVNTDCSQGDTDRVVKMDDSHVDTDRVVNTHCSQGDTDRVVKMDDSQGDTDRVVNTDCSQGDTDPVVKMDDSHVDTDHVVNTDCSKGDTGHVVNTDCSQGDTDRVVNTDFSQGDTDRVVNTDCSHVDTDRVVNTDCSQGDTDRVVKMDDSHVDTDRVVNTDCSQGDTDRVVNTDFSQGDTDRVVNSDCSQDDTDRVVNTDCSQGDTDHVLKMDDSHVDTDCVVNTDDSHVDTDHVVNTDCSQGDTDRLLKMDDSHVDTDRVVNTDCSQGDTDRVLKMDDSQVDTDRVVNTDCSQGDTDRVVKMDDSHVDTDRVVNTDDSHVDTDRVVNTDCSQGDTDRVMNTDCSQGNTDRVVNTDCSQGDTDRVLKMDDTHVDIDRVVKMDDSHVDTDRVVNTDCSQGDTERVVKMDDSHVDTDRVVNTDCSHVDTDRVVKMDDSQGDTDRVVNTDFSQGDTDRVVNTDCSQDDTDRVVNTDCSQDDTDRVVNTDCSQGDTDHVLKMDDSHVYTDCVVNTDDSHVDTDCVVNTDCSQGDTDRLLKMDDSHVDTDRVVNTDSSQGDTDRLLKMDDSHVDTDRVVNTDDSHVDTDRVVNTDCSQGDTDRVVKMDDSHVDTDRVVNTDCSQGDMEPRTNKRQCLQTSMRKILSRFFDIRRKASNQKLENHDSHVDTGHVVNTDCSQGDTDRVVNTDCSHVDTDRVVNTDCSQGDTDRVVKKDDSHVDTDRVVKMDDSHVDTDRVVNTDCSQGDTDRVMNTDCSQGDTDRVVNTDCSQGDTDRVVNTDFSQGDTDRVVNSDCSQDDTDRVVNTDCSQGDTDHVLKMDDSHVDTDCVVNTDDSHVDTDRVVNTDCSQGDTDRWLKMDDSHVDTDRVVNTDCSQGDTDRVLKMDDSHVDTDRVVNTDDSHVDTDRVVNTDCSQGDTDRVVKMDDSHVDTDRVVNTDDSHVDTDRVVNTDCSQGDTDRVVNTDCSQGNTDRVVNTDCSQGDTDRVLKMDDTHVDIDRVVKMDDSHVDTDRVVNTDCSQGDTDPVVKMDDSQGDTDRVVNTDCSQGDTESVVNTDCSQGDTGHVVNTDDSFGDTDCIVNIDGSHGNPFSATDVRGEGDRVLAASSSSGDLDMCTDKEKKICENSRVSEDRAEDMTKQSGCQAECRVSNKRKHEEDMEPRTNKRQCLQTSMRKTLSRFFDIRRKASNQKLEKKEVNRRKVGNFVRNFFRSRIGGRGSYSVEDKESQSLASAGDSRCSTAGEGVVTEECHSPAGRSQSSMKPAETEEKVSLAVEESNANLQLHTEGEQSEQRQPQTSSPEKTGDDRTEMPELQVHLAGGIEAMEEDQSASPPDPTLVTEVMEESLSPLPQFRTGRCEGSVVDTVERSEPCLLQRCTVGSLGGLKRTLLEPPELGICVSEGFSVTTEELDSQPLDFQPSASSDLGYTGTEGSQMISDGVDHYGDMSSEEDSSPVACEGLETEGYKVSEDRGNTDIVTNGLQQNESLEPAVARGETEEEEARESTPEAIIDRIWEKLSYCEKLTSPSTCIPKSKQATRRNCTENQPVPSSEPESRPVPSSEPKSLPVPSSEPESRSVPSSEPESRSVPSSEPESRPVPSSEPKSLPVPSSEPESGPVPSSEPESGPVPSSEPESRPVPSSEPKSLPVPSSEPESLPVPSSEPESLPVPSSEPESTASLSVSNLYTSNTSSEHAEDNSEGNRSQCAPVDGWINSSVICSDDSIDEELSLPSLQPLPPLSPFDFSGNQVPGVARQDKAGVRNQRQAGSESPIVTQQDFSRLDPGSSGKDCGKESRLDTVSELSCSFSDDENFMSPQVDFTLFSDDQNSTGQLSTVKDDNEQLSNSNPPQPDATENDYTPEMDLNFSEESRSNDVDYSSSGSLNLIPLPISDDSNHEFSDRDKTDGMKTEQYSFPFSSSSFRTCSVKRKCSFHGNSPSKRHQIEGASEDDSVMECEAAESRDHTFLIPPAATGSMADLPSTQALMQSTSYDLQDLSCSQVSRITTKLETKIKESPLSDSRQKLKNILNKVRNRKKQNVATEQVPPVVSADTEEGEEDVSMSEEPAARVQTAAETRLALLHSQMSRCKEVIGSLKEEFGGQLSLSHNPRVKTWRLELDELEKKLVPARTVIAVVGDTGAGKSSLMNALLDHRSVLPTSGMRACTAVVVEVVQNTQNDRLEADIEFLQPQEWIEELQLLLKDLTGLDGKVKTFPPDPTSEAFVSYCKVRAVYGKIDRLAVLSRQRAVTRWLGQTKVISSTNPEQFRRSVEKYIETQDPGAGGQFWPIVKHVRLRLPHCDACSSGAVLVDLPGCRDSNAARDKIAKEYLKNCTAVWVVSSIHRAIDDKTAKDLLGENFRRQLLMDGQYGSIAFICTKTDVITPSEIIRSLDLEGQCAEHEVQVGEMELRKAELERAVRRGRKEEAAKQRELDSLTEECSELRDDLKEMLLLMDPIDVDSEDMDTHEALDELKEELRQKEVSLREREKEVSELEQKSMESHRQVLVLERKLTVHRKAIAAICAAARNDYSKSQIRRDFKAGLKEMKRRAGALTEEEEEDDDDDDDDEDGSIGSTAENLQVFCCSSTEYQKMKNLLTDDGPAQVFSTLEETQIPALRNFVHEMTSVRRQQSAERLIRALGRFVFDLQSYMTVNIKPDPQQPGLEAASNRNRTEEEDKCDLHSQQTGLKLAEIDVAIKRALPTTGVVDVKKCLSAMKKLESLPVSHTILQRHPAISETLKKCQRYKRNEKIRKKAQKIIDKFNALSKPGATPVLEYCINKAKVLSQPASRQGTTPLSSTDTRHHVKSKVAGQLQQFQAMVQPVLGSLSADIDTVFDGSIRQKATEGAGQAMQEASDTCAKWGAPMCKDKANRRAGGLAWSTYRATVRRDGVFASPTYGRVDFNEELSEPMYRSLTIVWDRAFSGMLWRVLEKAGKKLLETLKQFTAQLCRELDLLGVPQVRSLMVSEQLHNSAANKLTEMVSQLKEIVTNKQRDISRVITPHVQETLGQAYRVCAVESGSGMFSRMKSHMSSAIDVSKYVMFDVASKKLMDLLMDLQREILDYVQTIVSNLMQDLRAAFEPLWEAPSNSNVLRAAFLPAVTAACSEVRQIYEAAGLDNTEERALASPEAGAGLGRSRSGESTLMQQGAGPSQPKRTEAYQCTDAGLQPGGQRLPARQDFTEVIYSRSIKQETVTCHGDERGEPVFGSETLSGICSGQLSLPPVGQTSQVPQSQGPQLQATHSRVVTPSGQTVAVLLKVPPKPATSMSSVTSLVHPVVPKLTTETRTDTVSGQRSSLVKKSSSSMATVTSSASTGQGGLGLVSLLAPTTRVQPGGTEEKEIKQTQTVLTKSWTKSLLQPTPGVRASPTRAGSPSTSRSVGKENNQTNLQSDTCHSPATKIKTEQPESARKKGRPIRLGRKHRNSPVSASRGVRSIFIKQEPGTDGPSQAPRPWRIKDLGTIDLTLSEDSD